MVKPVPAGDARRADAAAAGAGHRAAGDNFRDARRWADAAEAYLLHLAAHPDEGSIWIQAGNCFKEAGEFERSLDAYQQAEALDPKNFDVHLQLGHLHKITGHLPLALKAYEQAALLNPRFGEIKHEIQAVLERINAPASQNGWADLSHPTLDRLLAVMKMQEGEDLFAGYFRSLGAQ